MTCTKKHSESKKWKPDNHYRSFVYRPYYYTYYDYPYFESQYISDNSEIYDPTIKPINIIKLQDGTNIETFSNKQGRLDIFVIIFLAILFMIFIYAK